MTCRDCHHTPSGRIAEYGAACYCKCHDIADAAPDLLAALESLLAVFVEAVQLPDPFLEAAQAEHKARAAITKAKGGS